MSYNEQNTPINIAGITAFFGSYLLILSTAYDYCFYIGLGIDVSFVPTNINDIISGTITWIIPLTLMFMLTIAPLICLYYIFSPKIINISTVYIVYGITITLIILIIYNTYDNGYFIATSDIDSISAISFLLTSILIIMVNYIDEKTTNKRTLRYVASTFIILTVYVGLNGVISGISLSNSRDRLDSLELKIGQLYDIKIIRNYQAGSLILKNQSEFMFINKDEIISTFTVGRKAYLGVSEDRLKSLVPNVIPMDRSLAPPTP